MKRLVLLLLVTALTIASSACGQSSTVPVSIQTEPTTAESIQAPESLGSSASASDSSSNVSQPLAEEKTLWLEDYDTFWTIVEENYPLYAAAQRITGNDFAAIKEKYRPMVADTILVTGLQGILNSCVQEFKGTGHFWLFEDTNAYRSMSISYGRIAEDSPKCSYLYNRLNNHASIAYYKFDPAPELERIIESGGNQTGTADNGNLKFVDYPKDKTAYVSIAKMTKRFDNNDGKVLEDWFRTLESKGYTNCILDIRGNGGGSSDYWYNYIVSPNLKNTSSATNYALVKGDECINYWQAVGKKLEPISTLPVKNLPALLPEDLDGATYFINHTTEMTPSGAPLFSGRFWLLVDDKVYSSSEMLAAFCKDAGFATLVGTPTGGDGIGQDPLVFALPNSGICFRFTAELGLNADGSCNEEVGTQPDIAIKPGEDALEVCLAEIRNNTKESMKNKFFIPTF